jgi:hypothetical protein
MATEALGWREWVSLPDLGIDQIKAKIDTGARTSALHAFDVELTQEGDQKTIKFSLHPYQRNTDTVVHCQAPLLDERTVRDSGGHEEIRYVIETKIVIGGAEHKAEVTLTNRDNMGFRMLIGRTTMKDIYIVDPGRSFLKGKKKKQVQTT